MKALNSLLFCGLIVSGTVSADISYNFIEVGFGTVAVDVVAPLDGQGDGPQLSASHELIGPFRAFVHASQMDFSKDGVEIDDTKVGLGWHHSLGANASTFVDLAYVHKDVNPGASQGFAQDGYGVTLGYRAENHTPWEFVGTIDYVSVESGDDLGAGMSLIFDATPHFSVSGGISYFDNSAMAFMGARYSFTRND